MIKLHPDTAQEIANLITAKDAASIMSRDEKDHGKQCYWMAEECKAIIKLKEDYGIPHNVYASAVKWMEMPMYANATLSEVTV